MPRYAYERLSAQDNSFLLMEQPSVHMHVAATQIYEAGPLRTPEGGIDVDAFKRAIESVLHLIPRYRQKLQWIPFENHPVWVDDWNFNLGYHIRHTSLPRPGTDTQLKQLAARIMAAAARPHEAALGVLGGRRPARRPLRGHQQGAPLHDRRRIRRRTDAGHDVGDAGTQRAGPRALHPPPGPVRLRVVARRVEPTAEPAPRHDAQPARVQPADRGHAAGNRHAGAGVGRTPGLRHQRRVGHAAQRPHRAASARRLAQHAARRRQGGAPRPRLHRQRHRSGHGDRRRPRVHDPPPCASRPPRLPRVRAGERTPRGRARNDGQPGVELDPALAPRRSGPAQAGREDPRTSRRRSSVRSRPSAWRC